MILDLISFSFNQSTLPVANYLIDVRFLNNPFYIDELRGLTGLDNDVIKFFENDQLAQSFLKELYKWITFIVQANKNADKGKIIIAIGCTGGQHRSPYIIECLGKYLVKKKLVSELSIYHRELKKYNVNVAI